MTTTCFSAQFFNGAGIILFAFTNQCNVLPVYSELVNPVKYRLMKIIKRQHSETVETRKDAIRENMALAHAAGEEQLVRSAEHALEEEDEKFQNFIALASQMATLGFHVKEVPAQGDCGVFAMMELERRGCHAFVEGQLEFCIVLIDPPI